MRLQQAYPQPRPITLGGVRCLALPLRVKHLAAIETWLESALPDPVEPYRGRILEAEGEERRLLAAQAILKAEGWPPDVAEADRYLATPEGVRFLLGLTVMPCDPLAEDEIETIVEAITFDEYLVWMRLAYGSTALDELGQIVQPAEDHPGPRRSWGEVLYMLADGRPEAIAAIGEMFITQFALLTSQGKAGEGLAGTTTKEARQERRRLFAEARKRNQAEEGDTDGSD